jgi:hypothetical protein
MKYSKMAAFGQDIFFYRLEVLGFCSRWCVLARGSRFVVGSGFESAPTVILPQCVFNWF